MKHLIYGLGGTALVIVVIMIIITVNGKMTRSKELTSTLSSAVDQSVENVMQDKSYTINNKDEFIADVIQNLLNTYENDSEIEIQVMAADDEKGLLALRVIEHYVNPNGKEGSNTYDKTVIFDSIDYQKEYTVRYYDENDILLAEYKVIQSQNIPTPGIQTDWYLQKYNPDYDETNSFSDIYIYMPMTITEINNLTATENIPTINSVITFKKKNK